MSGPVQSISIIEELRPFVNKDGIIEIVLRNKEKKFKQFVKIAINSDSEQKQTAKQMAKIKSLLNNNLLATRKNLEVSQNTLKTVQSLSKLNAVSIVLEGANLCATCAGFAIMIAKLNEMSAQIESVIQLIREQQNSQVEYEFSKVLSEHRDMLDGRKTQCYYTEQQMRTLVDMEYNMLKMILRVYSKSDKREEILAAISLLASMLSVSIRYFDEVYYFNHKDVIGDNDPWHSSHRDWMEVFDKMQTEDFIASVQDYAFLELPLNTTNADFYCKQFIEQVIEAKQSIIDNQTLISTFDDASLFKLFHEVSNKQIREEIEKAIELSETNMTDREKTEIFKRMAIA